MPGVKTNETMGTSNNNNTYEKSSENMIDNSQMDVEDTILETLSKVITQPTPNDTMQEKLVKGPVQIVTNGIESTPEVTVTEVTEPLKNVNEEHTENLNIFMDVNAAIEVTKIEILDSPSDLNVVSIENSDVNLQATDEKKDQKILDSPPDLNIVSIENSDDNLQATDEKKDQQILDSATDLNEVTKENSDNNLQATDEKKDQPILDSPPDLNVNVSKESSDDNLHTDEKKDQQVSPSNDTESQSNSSSMKLEHMKSLKIVLKRTEYFGCDNCNLVFFKERDVKLHALKHLLPSRKDNNDDDRFVKRFKCEECGLRFVQLSTLEAHATVHAPFEHVCHCGIGFYRRADLNSHKNLVHLAEIRDQLATLTDRQQKAFKHEIWEPNVAYTVKKEPRPDPKPKRRTKSGVNKPRSTPQVERYKCDEENLIVQNDDKTFSCPICSKRYKAKAGVKTHLATHAAVKPYLCNLCGTRFTQSAGLYTHKKLHLGVKQFKCAFCGKEFSTEHNMRTHTRTHTGEKPFQCTFCPKAFSDQSAHKRHERTHTGFKPYTCDFCGMKFSDASGLIAHRRRHNGTKQHECSKCHKKFWTNDALRKHTKSVHSHAKDHTCPVCNKSFAIKPYLAIHMKSHTEEKRFECDYCGFRARMKHFLISHIRAVHLLVKNVSCPECATMFSSETFMRRHYANVHSRELKFECDVCSERYNLKSDLFKHIIVKHSEVKCNTCLKRFSCSADLRKHSKEGCHKCECGKYFPTHHQLRSHKLVHDSYKPYLCSFCDRRFKTRSCLKKHYETVHENTKKFECNDCGEQFSVRPHILKHIFTKHLPCVYCHKCNRSFYSDTALKAHKARNLCNVKLTCHICNKVFVTKNRLLTHLNYHRDIFVYCNHCPSKFKAKGILIRHLRLCHKRLFSKKSKKTK